MTWFGHHTEIGSLGRWSVGEGRGGGGGWSLFVHCRSLAPEILRTTCQAVGHRPFSEFIGKAMSAKRTEEECDILAGASAKRCLCLPEISEIPNPSSRDLVLGGSLD